ncbi:SGNH hydrolase-type esterase domain-containing protein [Flagelloscypha sp. PMI_526]|nr:SGNH hydrolase-type esterase domain-containing protein [Flagelloscypha sp. PMI_526]
MAAYVQNAFVLFGDSITQGSFEPGLNGIGQRFAHLYLRKLDVLNRGFGGYNTEWCTPILEQCLGLKSEREGVPKVLLMTIWLGANDAAQAPSAHHVPLERYKINLENLVKMVQSPESPYHSPETKLILLTPPPVNPALRPDDTHRTFEVTKSYADTARDVANTLSVPLVDTWTLLWDGAEHKMEGLEKYLPDGLHLSAAAYEAVFNELDKVIKETYPQVYHENIERVWPEWSEIDPANYLPAVEKKALRFKPEISEE